MVKTHNPYDPSPVQSCEGLFMLGASAIVELNQINDMGTLNHISAKSTMIRSEQLTCISLTRSFFTVRKYCRVESIFA